MTTTAGAPAAPSSGAPAPDDLRGLDAWWRAANYLAVGQIYLMDNPLLREPLASEHIKPRLLGHWGTTPGLTFLWAHLNRRHRPRRPRRALRHRPRARRPGRGGDGVPGGHVLGAVRARHRRRRGHEGAVPAVLLPRRHPQPRRAGDPGLDPRGRRARLRALARLRRGVRQPGPAGRLRDRRRRGRDRSAVRVVAGEQVPPPGQRRHRAADPAPQRLQDRQLDGDGPDLRGGAAPAAGGARPPALRRRGRVRRRGPHGRPRADGRDAGRDRRRDRPDPGPRQGAVRRRGAGRPATLARARPAHPEGLDGTARGGRQARRGHVARAPGAAVGDPRQRRAPRPAGAVAAVVPAGGAVRRRGPVGPRAARAQPARARSG